MNVNHSISEAEFKELCSMSIFTFKDIEGGIWSVTLVDSGKDADIKIPELQLRTLVEGSVITIAKPRLDKIFNFALSDIGYHKIYQIISSCL